MKTILKLTALALLLTVGNTVKANVKLTASDSTQISTTYKNSFGVHFGARLTNVFSSINSNLYPYRFSYRRYNGQNALRAGISARFDNDRSLALSDSSFTSQKGGYFSYRIGVGYERYKSVSNRFNIYYGGELNHFLRREKSVSTGLNTSEKSIRFRNSVEVAPVLGLEVKLSKGFSISTELMWSIGMEFGNTKTELNNNGNVSMNEVKSTSIITSLHFPRGLTLRYNF